MSDFKMEACSSPAPKGFQGGNPLCGSGCGLSPCQTNIKYCFHINYPFTKHQKTSKFMGCDVVPLIFKTSKYIKQKKKELYLFSCLSIFANIWQMLEIYQKFHGTKEAFLGIWKKSQKNLELVKLLQSLFLSMVSIFVLFAPSQSPHQPFHHSMPLIWQVVCVLISLILHHLFFVLMVLLVLLGTLSFSF